MPFYILIVLALFALTACDHQDTVGQDTANQNNVSQNAINQPKTPSPIAFNINTHIDIDKRVLAQAARHDHYIDTILGYYDDSDDVYQKDGETPITYSSVADSQSIATYAIDKGKLQPIDGKLSTADDKKVRENFALFYHLIPKPYQANLAYLSIYQDSDAGAYITELEDDPDVKVVGFNLNQLMDRHGGKAQKYELLTLFVHEFAHLFSMDSGQKITDPSAQVIFEDYKNDAYLSQFYQAFWQDVPADYQDNSDKSAQALHDFYHANQANFVNAYAATNPHEDFAESFKVFVTDYVPSERDEANVEKVLFFYQYPELVTLRARLLKNIVAIVG